MKKTGLSQTASRFLRDQRGITALHAAMIFAATGIGVALFFQPSAQKTVESVAELTGAGVDRTVTGSVKRYTVRRSVLQKKGGVEPCIIMANGSERGDC